MEKGGWSSLAQNWVLDGSCYVAKKPMPEKLKQPQIFLTDFK
jgi:hypothetical protein